LIRGIFAGALLAFATSLALQGALQTNVPLVGALIFPAGFAVIVVLGLELLTGNFGLVPLAALSGRTTALRMLANWIWVFAGNMLAPSAKLSKATAPIGEIDEIGRGENDGYQGRGEEAVFNVAGGRFGHPTHLPTRSSFAQALMMEGDDDPGFGLDQVDRP
jgi:hypothetical protein